MSTMLPEPPVTEPAAPPRPDDLFAASLQDRLPEWFRTSGAFTGMTAAAAAVFFFYSLMPLLHTDLWGHLAYGRILWTTRQIPTTEPLMPLAAGVPFVDTAWLSQVVGYGIVSRFGLAGAKLLFAAPIAICCGLLMGRVYRRTGSGWFAVASIPLLLLIDWQQLLVVRPQLAGLVCFLALFAMLTGRTWPRFGWVGVPVLFALWANLHGSFVVGLATLAAFCAGRAVDVWRRSGRFASIASDADVRRYFVLTELALLGTLLNPYGAGIYAEVLSFSANPNLTDINDWQPLSLRMKQGQAAAAAALLLVILYRLSPRRIATVELLLLAGLGGAALWTSRMLTWWGPVAAYFAVLHGHAVWTRLGKGKPVARPAAPRSVWTVAAIGIAFIAFALTPFGMTVTSSVRASVLGRKPANRVESRAWVSTQTPIGAVQYLEKNPPQGQVYNTQELGDFLTWRLPGIRVFATSHVHLIPEEVWESYQHVSNLTAGWSEVLDNYGVNTVVLDPHVQQLLARSLRRDDGWRVGYEDTSTVVLVRRTPL